MNFLFIITIKCNFNKIDYFFVDGQQFNCILLCNYLHVTIKVFAELAVQAIRIELSPRLQIEQKFCCT